MCIQQGGILDMLANTLAAHMTAANPVIVPIRKPRLVVPGEAAFNTETPG